MHFFLLILLIFTTQQFAAQRLIGDSKSKTSFTFDLGQSAYVAGDGRFFVSAAQAVPHNAFALAFAERNSRFFVALAPEKVVLNGKEESLNPLHGAAIRHLAFMGRRAIVVSQEDPNFLSLVLNFSIKFEKGKRPEVVRIDQITSPVVNDALGIASSGISGVAATSASNVLFVAVNAHDANSFGSPGAGVAVGFLKDPKPMPNDTNKNEKEKQEALPFDKNVSFFNAITGEVNGNKAAPIDAHSSFIKIGKRVKRITNKLVNLRVFADLGQETVYSPSGTGK